MIEINEIAQRSSNTYGRCRILESLIDKGYKLGLYKAASLMKRAQVVVINPVKKHYYPDMR